MCVRAWACVCVCVWVGGWEGGVKCVVRMQFTDICCHLNNLKTSIINMERLNKTKEELHLSGPSHPLDFRHYANKQKHNKSQNKTKNAFDRSCLLASLMIKM